MSYSRKMRLILFCHLFICFSHRVGNTRHLGSDYSLECLNDYLFTINCVLNVSSEVLAHNATSWLEFNDDRGSFKCVLKALTHSWVCVLDLTEMLEDTFMDTDDFQISLNYSYHGNSNSTVLETHYKPLKYIRPIPPSNLSLLWETERAVFHWLSGYPDDVFLVPALQYELSIHNNTQVVLLHPRSSSVEVGVSNFAPHTAYTARVRSSPNQVYYVGVWSQWGPAIHWRTGAIHKSLDESFPSGWFALLCLLPALLLFYVPYSRWKSHVLIPSPAPYFKDFKSWVMLPGVMGELLHREESLKIDSMIEDGDSTPQQSPTHYEKMRTAYDISGLEFKSDPPTFPSMLHSALQVDVNSSALLNDVSAAERSSVTCSDDYCALEHTAH